MRSFQRTILWRRLEADDLGLARRYAGGWEREAAL
jgi:hypothetical protein